ncbi:hypothetical protein D6856_08065 [Butyrivibrio sp. XB500-5]|uniref:hypothetical protein n=1 Tax=Butyrivibrio sp. XB500-5 TaxID=2364880 RepID=UPI000EA99CBA|nr:hypothetical protein [Butyrivibrio sp. XB500-5]RKM60030.1 hypothetical protein D6856_08065 [Butyrivibrio sp. XB500-5]
MMKRKMGKIALSTTLSTLMMLTMPITALAGEWDIAVGDIAVNRTSETEQNVSQGDRSENDTNPTITGSSTEHTVTITAATGTTATVTLEDVHIESSSDNAPVSTHGGGNVTIELDGNSTITSYSNNYAGIQKENSENLTITDSDGTPSGSIAATGGRKAAGIGSGNEEDASSITITGNANVTASSFIGAGIGGGYKGSGSYITISENATVTASSDSGAGIGGGYAGNGSNITITGDANVTASSVIYGAGIGGGDSGNGSNITISGNATIIASSIEGGAGIGSGESGAWSNITISENATVHVAGGLSSDEYFFNGAAIGNGAYGRSNGSEVVDTSNLTTGSITIYDPGTTVDEIIAYIEQSQSQYDGQQDPDSGQQPPDDSQQSQAGSQQNPPIVPPVVNITEDNENAAPEAIPTRTRSGGSHSSNNNGATVNTPAPNIDYALFVAALNTQIEDYIKQLYEAINSGDSDKANAMIKEGLQLNLGNFVGLNSKTIALLEEVSKAGIATTIDFTYKNIDYRTLIPANAEIAPTSLLNKDGYCGALKLMKEYGRIEENNSPSDIG